MNDSLKKLLQILKDEGESDKSIAVVLESITGIVTPTLFQDMATVLTEEDIQLLDTIKDEQEFQEKVKSLYSQRSGKSPEDLINEITDKFVEGFLARYHQDKQAALAQPVVK
ncbi:MAG: hypothetical protein Q7S31_02765 [bacterium]|nr:hypothetical protein [bacterium]